MGGAGGGASSPGLKFSIAADYGVYTNGYARFRSAVDQYLTLDDTASLPTGDIDSWWAGWFRGDTLVSQTVAMSKWNTGTNNAEWALYQPGNVFRYLVSPDGVAGNSTFVNSTVTLSPDIWYFSLIWHDSVNNTINIRVDTESAQSVPYSGGIFDGNAPFRISGIVGTQYWNGGAYSVCCGKNPVGGVAAQISDIYTTLYNGGAGVTPSGVTAAQRTAWGGVSFWYLNEAFNTRYDAWAANDLTASTTIIISGATLNGNFETAGVNGGTISNSQTATVARTANVATIVTGAAHGLITGNQVSVGSATDPTFNTTNSTVTVTNSTTFTYANTGSNVGTTPDTAGRVYTSVFANWTSILQGTSTLNNETSVVPIGSTHAARLDIDAGSDVIYLYQICCIAGNLYDFTFESKCNTGSAIVSAADNSGHSTSFTVNTTYTEYAGSSNPADAYFYLFTSSGSKSVYISKVTLIDKGPVGLPGGVSGLAAEDDNVSSWLDQSTSLTNVTQTTVAARPIYHLNVQNGKPGVLFNGATQNLNNSNAAIPVGNSERTILMVIKQTIAQFSFPLFWSAGGAAHCGINISSGTFKAYLENYYDSGISIANNTTYILGLTFSAGVLKTYVNGVAGASFSGITPVQTGIADLYVGSIFLGQTSFGGYVFDGEIFDRLLNPGQLIQENAILNSRWRVY